MGATEGCELRSTGVCVWRGGGGGDQGSWAHEMGRTGVASSADGLFSEQKGAIEHEQAWPVGE